MHENSQLDGRIEAKTKIIKKEEGQFLYLVLDLRGHIRHVLMFHCYAFD